MSQKPYGTRGNKIKIPETMEKKTMVQIRQEKAAKEAAEKEKKEAKKVAKEQAASKHKVSARVVAAAEDKQAADDEVFQSIRPDLELTENSPSAATSESNTPTASLVSAHISLSDTEDDNNPNNSKPPPSSDPGTDGELAFSMDIDEQEEPAEKVDSPASGSAFELSGSEVSGSDAEDVNEEIAELQAAPKTANKIRGNAADLGSDGEVASNADDEDSEAEVLRKALEEYRKKKGKAKPDAKKEKAEKAKLARKQEKSEVRNEVSKARQSDNPKPSPNEASTSSTKRPASSDVEGEAQSKKPKGAPVGGLKPGWKATLYGLKKQKASEPSSSSEVVVGEFDVDESHESLSKAREASDGSVKKNQIVLKPANVKAIDAKERGKTNTDKPRRRQTTQSDLPFATTAERDRWTKIVWPGILKWVGTVSNQFGVNGEIDLKTIISQLWAKHYPEPTTYDDPKSGKKRPLLEHPAIFGFVQSALRTFRSEIGKRALSIIRLKAKECASVEAVSDWVKEQLENDRWIYADAGPTREESTGAFRGPLLLETFAYFLAKIGTSDEEYDFPAGALALSAAAVLRALKSFETGVDTIQEAIDVGKEEAKKSGKRAKRVTMTSFGDNWQKTVEGFYNDYTSKLSEKKWHQLLEATEGFTSTVSSADPIVEDAATANETRSQGNNAAVVSSSPQSSADSLHGQALLGHQTLAVLQASAQLIGSGTIRASSVCVARIHVVIDSQPNVLNVLNYLNYLNAALKDINSTLNILKYLNQWSPQNFLYCCQPLGARLQMPRQCFNASTPSQQLYDARIVKTPSILNISNNCYACSSCPRVPNLQKMQMRIGGRIQQWIGWGQLFHGSISGSRGLKDRGSQFHLL
ncbi:hypothetical protein D9758_016976 [Tetrapyrgos nigripes]|uniref:DUF6532 domain-containing protein n=1 Tax=Tetrapyrgos nigripes TaxID=182062 RepID=A0A8H5FIM4_9AGAR|nr:hypothetical protein D9758_016976 [Tetrapyrgos nigripes]